MVQIVYGSASGLSTAGDQLLFQGQDGLADSPEDQDMFGSALAVGNFDGDRYDDLAIGVPKEDYFGADAGIAHLLWGDAGGITTINDLLLQQELISGESHEVNDRFGWALAAADF